MKILLTILLFINTLLSYEDLVAKEEEANRLKTVNSVNSQDKDPTDLDLLQDTFIFNSKDKGKAKINQNIQVLDYEANSTIHIRTRLMVKSLIVLDKEESIRAFIVGNDFGFKAEIIKTVDNKNSNMLSITPKFARIDTNLNIISSSGRVYSFYIYSTIIKHNKLPHFTTYVNIKKEDKFKSSLIKGEALKRDNIPFNIEKVALNSLNFDYSISEDVGVEAVFSNIDKTFIKLKKGVVIADLINYHSKESIPYSKDGDYLIVNKHLKEFLIGISSFWNKDRQVYIKKNKDYKQNFVKDEIYINLHNLNFLYSIYSGEDNNYFMPIIIFSDKKFTYFQFDTSRADKKYPNIYRVVDKIDNPLSTAISGNFLIAKDLSNKFTLKIGQDTICISKGNI